MTKPKAPKEVEKAAAWLVVTGQVGSPSPEPTSKRRKKEKTPIEPPEPSVRDSEKIRHDLVSRHKTIDLTKDQPVNLGPNPPGTRLHQLSRVEADRKERFRPCTTTFRCSRLPRRRALPMATLACRP